MYQHFYIHMISINFRYIVLKLHEANQNLILLICTDYKIFMSDILDCLAYVFHNSQTVVNVFLNSRSCHFSVFPILKHVSSTLSFYRAKIFAVKPMFFQYILHRDLSLISTFRFYIFDSLCSLILFNIVFCITKCVVRFNFSLIFMLFEVIFFK